MKAQARKQVGSFQVATDNIERDPNHHLTGPFLPQTPLGSLTPIRGGSPHRPRPKHPVTPRWLKWATDPYVALQLLITPIVLYFNWQLVSPSIAPGLPNPFASVFLLSGLLEDSKPGDPRYAKSYNDFVFLAYYIVFFSFLRQFIATNISQPVARYFGLKKVAKMDRFGEQFYALIYFSVFGAWGYRVMGQLPSYWYKTEQLWIDYPHWNMKPELKRYYLMQLAYWCQQFIVLILGLEKPRKDYHELVAHHFVTLWLVGWSYLLNFTVIGNAVYMSMDIPDAFLAASKLLNYIQWERAKTVSFVTFIGVWTYFRHYLNIKMLWSVLFESSIAPVTKTWDWELGVYLPGWMPSVIFLSIFALQILNLFWYYLMWRILIRGIVTRAVDDDRSDEDNEDNEDEASFNKRRD